MNRALLPAALLALLGVAAPVAAEMPGPERQRQLKTLLYQDCGSCHGMTLRGGLGPPLGTQRMNAYDRDSLARLILTGIPGTAMPGWEALLSEADARWLADHLQNDNPLEE